METKLRHRVIGAVVLFAIAMIMIPFFFKSGNSSFSSPTNTSEQIPSPPPKPSEKNFTSHLNTNLPSENKTPTILAKKDNELEAAETFKAETKIAPIHQDQPELHKAQVDFHYNTSTENEARQKPLVADSSENDAKIAAKMNLVEEKVLAVNSDSSIADISSNKLKNHKEVVKILSHKINSNHHQIPVSYPVESVSTVKKSPNNNSVKGWVVQLGTFTHLANAQQLEKQLLKHGFSAFSLPMPSSHGEMTCVLIGPELGRENAEIVLSRLDKEVHIKGMIKPFDSM